MVRTVVLYDEDCGFCRWSAGRLRAWDRHGRLAFAPIQGPEGERLLAGLDRDARLDSLHAVTPDDRVWSAGAALPPVVRALPGVAIAATLATKAPRLTEAAYRLVAGRRDRLGRLLGHQACGIDPSSPRPRSLGAPREAPGSRPRVG